MVSVESIEQLQVVATRELLGARQALLDVMPHLANLVLPEGYRPKIQVSTQSKGDPGKIRKKRATAGTESFDPRKDCLLITFDSDSEIHAEEVFPIKVESESAFAPPPTESPVSGVSQFSQRRAVIEALSRTEASKPAFVGLKYFRDRQMPQLGSSEGEEERRHQILREMIASGIIQTGKAHNPRNPEFPVTTIELNRQHPDVRAILDQRPSAAQSEFAPIVQRGELASRLILKDRR